MNSKQRLIQMIRHAQPASLGSSLLRLARLAEAAHRHEVAAQLRRQHASRSDASGRNGQAGSYDTSEGDKDVAARAASLDGPSSFRTEVAR
ncbi:MAG: hypothetical protein WD768_17055 [Phycisphaeraceae bacterium]